MCLIYLWEGREQAEKDTFEVSALMTWQQEEWEGGQCPSVEISQLYCFMRRGTRDSWFILHVTLVGSVFHHSGKWQLFMVCGGFFWVFPLWCLCDSLHWCNSNWDYIFQKKYSDHVKKQRRYSFFPALKNQLQNLRKVSFIIVHPKHHFLAHGLAKKP